MVINSSEHIFYHQNRKSIKIPLSSHDFFFFLFHFAKPFFPCHRQPWLIPANCRVCFSASANALFLSDKDCRRGVKGIQSLHFYIVSETPMLRNHYFSGVDRCWPNYLGTSLSGDQFFWRPVFLATSFFGNQFFCVNFFWVTIFLFSWYYFFWVLDFLCVRFSGHWIFWAPNFLGTIHSGYQIFWVPVFQGSSFLRTKFSGFKFFLALLFLGTRFSVCQIFWAPDFLGKRYSGYHIFRDQHFYEPNFLGIRFSVYQFLWVPDFLSARFFGYYIVVWEFNFSGYQSFFVPVFLPISVLGHKISWVPTFMFLFCCVQDYQFSLYQFFRKSKWVNTFEPQYFWPNWYLFTIKVSRKNIIVWEEGARS